MELTLDSKILICVMYKNYLEKRNSGATKYQANSFGSSHNIHERLLPGWSFEDVDATCRELSRAGLLSCIWANNIPYRISISDQGIIYMENRFKNGLSSVLNFLSKVL